MEKIEIKKDIFWVGAIDWNMRSFHGHTYTTNRGTTYNAYLVVDEKVALVDTVYAPFTRDLVEKIKQVVDPAKIDYIIANHVEADHSGALPEIMKLCPKAKVFGTAKCKEGLYRNYYGNWDFQVVKTGDKLELGKKTLSFIEAPMIHWPDSMFTYCPQEKLLMPNDAFGQHYATSVRFDDEANECELMDEAEKYYANILWPLSTIIMKKLEEISGMQLAIDMIAPSHGIIWRRDPGKIVNAYASWVKNPTLPKAVIVFETMWGATEKMARKIYEGLIDGGVAARVIDITRTDHTEAIKELFGAKGYLFGSSTHDNDMLPTLAGFLEFLKGLRPQNRVAAAFGSYGWAGGAVKSIEAVLGKSGINLARPGLGIQYMPDAAGLEQCYDFGKNMAADIKKDR